MDKYIIEAADVMAAYEDSKELALKGISLTVREGKRTAFIGRNGAGKSTFFLCLNGIQRICGGSLKILGKEISYDKKSLLNLRKNVGLVFQDPDKQLFMASVRQEISFGPMNLGILEKEVATKVDTIMDKLEITHLKNKPTHALSGGQKKQVTIADVLVMEPRIIIMDEPQAYLDGYYEGKVLELMNMMSGAGITILLATHDMDFALAWAEDVIYIEDGMCLFCGDAQEFFYSYMPEMDLKVKRPHVVTLRDILLKKGMVDETFMPKNMEEISEVLK